MTVQYCSDLHLEFYDNAALIKAKPIKPVGDVLVLAGDITNLHKIDYHREFFDYISDNFKQTWWIPGNHEYYHNDIVPRSGAFEEKIRDNVSLINNKVVHHSGCQLIFSTLWSHINLLNAWRIEKSMNDFYQITLNAKRFTVPDYNNLHNDSVNFLQDALNGANAGKTIVVTHHVPTFQNYPPEYRNDFLNEAFATNLDGLLLDTKPDYWIYGHHHRNIPEFKIGDTSLLTNQLGYVQNGEHHWFSRDRCIEL